MISLLKDHNKYRNLVISYSLSVLIDSMIFMTLLKYVELESDANFYFTIFYLAYYLPAAFFSLFIGAWIEKQTLQKVMKYSVWIRIALMFTLLFSFEYMPFWGIFVFIFLEATIALFFLPANDSLVPRLVEQKERINANSLIKLLFVIMHIVGYLISTLLIKMHIPFVIIFIISIGGLLLCINRLVKVTPLIKGEADKSQTLKSLTVGGIMYILTKDKIKVVFILFAFAWLVASSIDIIIIEYLTTVSKIGSEMFGFVAAGTLLGMIVGASISSLLYNKVNLKWLFILPLFIYSLTIESMSIFENWIFILPFFFIGGISLGIYEVIFTTYLQDNIEEIYFARVFSIYNMILNSMPLPGLLFLGISISHIGIFQTIHVISLFLMVLSVSSLIFLPSFRSEKTLVQQKT